MNSLSERSLIVVIFLSLIAAFFLMRLFVLQVVRAEEYTFKGDRQYTPAASDLFDRGNIFFTERGGARVSAATQKTGFTLAINPRLVDVDEDARSVAWKLKAIVPIKEEEFVAKAGKDDPYEEIMSQLTPEQAAAVRTLNIDGIFLERERWRFYPGGSTAAHILGFVGYVGEERSGRYGLERYYEDVLYRDTSAGEKNFFFELFANVEKSFAEDDTREGDLVITIEPTVQRFLETRIKEIQKDWESKSVGGIIMNPKTGAIYAMAATPDFDPNLFFQEKSSARFSNPFVESVYELGSVVKPLVMAAALDVGVVTAQTSYEDTGAVAVGSATIRNFDGKKRGVQTMQDVLTKSLNTGMVFVQQRLGKEPMREYLLSFGINSETGIDVPGEVPGLANAILHNRDVEFATAAFGQGIALTPIGAVRAFSALGNGGYLPDPYLVEEIDYALGRSRKHYPDPPTRVIKQETSEEITRMLVEVGDNIAGGSVKLPGYSVAVKTGTAQVPNQSGGYHADRHFHSFFGYFPAYDPEFIIFLFNQEPKGATFSVETLPGPFRDITKFLISYYEIPPDR